MDNKNIDPSFLKGLAFRILNDKTNDLNYMQDFKLFREGHAFDIYHYQPKALPKQYFQLIELAVIRETPKPHMHIEEGVAWFYFLDSNGAITLGGAKDDKTCCLTKIKVPAYQFLPIAPYIFHAGGPWDESKSTELLILNSGFRDRPEDDNYTLDSEYRAKEMRFANVLF